LPSDPKLHKRLCGIHLTMATPLDRSNGLDEPALRDLVDLVIANGVDVINYPLTVGESGSLSFDEHVRAVEVVARQVDGRVPFLAGIGRSSTAESLRLARHCEAIGATGLVGLQPYYFKLAQDEIFEHYRILTEASRLPLIVYNHPAATRVSITPDMAARLAELPRLVGFFPTNTDVGELFEFSRVLDGKVLQIVGREETMLFARVLRCEAQSSSTFHFAPALIKEIWKLVQAGQDRRAFEMYQRLHAWRALVKRKLEAGYFGGFAAYIKASMALLGWPIGEPRAPLRPLSASEREELRRVLVEDMQLAPFGTR
jgi:dihydrodipicolinate synthase/N-acetylneuraminate lyase